MRSDEESGRFLRQGRVHCVSVPAEFFVDYVEKGAPAHILALQQGCQDVGRDQATAGRKIACIAKQIIVAPAASIQSMAVPAHGGVNSLYHTAQFERRSI